MGTSREEGKEGGGDAPAHKAEASQTHTLLSFALATASVVLTQHAPFPHTHHAHTNSIREMCRFMSKTLIKRCQPGQRQTIQHEGMCVCCVCAFVRGPLSQTRKTKSAHLISSRSLSIPLTKPKTEYNVHCHLRTDGLGGTVIADLEYPPRVAFVLLSTILDRFAVDITYVLNDYICASA